MFKCHPRNPTVVSVSVSNRYENRADAMRNWLISLPTKLIINEPRYNRHLFATLTSRRTGDLKPSQDLTGVAQGDLQVDVGGGNRMRVVADELSNAPYSVMFLEYTGGVEFQCSGTENFTDVVEAFECFKYRIENKCPQWPSHVKASQIPDQIIITPAIQSIAMANRQMINRPNRQR